MSLYPEVQRKAQEELDRVVGPNRLPDFSDYDNLVYIQAIALESIRWIIIFPLGVSHRLICDDEYKGFFIPRGTTIMPVSYVFSLLRKILTSLVEHLASGYKPTVMQCS